MADLVRFVAVLLLTLTFAEPQGFAQAVQVADLDTLALNLAGLDESPMLAVGGVVYFRGRDAAHGWELWRSEGTAESTRLVRDICPGPCDSSPDQLIERGGEVTFFAQDGTTGRELWKSDGTAAGTQLIRDIFLGASDSEPYVLGQQGIVRLGDRLYFGATDLAKGLELWTSDGTRAGTRRVVDLCPGACGAEVSGLTAIGDQLFFFASDGVVGKEPWRSDGTAEGTVLLGDFCDGRCGSFGGVFFAHQGQAYLWRASLESTGVCWNLWRPGDPMTDVTVRLCGSLGSPPPQTAELNGLHYLGWDDSLWRLDAPASEIVEAVRFQGPVEGVVRMGSHLFFAARSSQAGQELWRSNGTARGTVLLLDAEPGAASGHPGQLTPAGDRLFFTSSDELSFPFARKLWVTDGSRAGTLEIRPPAAPSLPLFYGSLSVVGDRLFFSADRSDIGRELWKTDGTLAGTALVRDLHADPGSANPEALAALGNTLVFGAQQAVGNSLETSIWRTDGTAGGTAVLLPSSAPSGVSAVLRGALFFGVDFRLFRTDGTVQGTFEIPETLPFEMQAAGDRLFLSAYGRLHGEVHAGHELWQSDGTTAGTRLVKDIVPGIPGGGPFPFPNSSNPRGLTPWGTGVLFAASDFEHLSELWVSDGSAAGTVLVKDICPGLCPSEIAELTLFGGRAFFAADDGSSGRELWVSDGTAAGTSRVVDLLPGRPSSSPRDLIVFRGRLFFYADDGQGNEHLWSSDGTAAGTRRIAGPGLPKPRHEPAIAGDRLFFTAWTDAEGQELWSTDGTSAGTRLVADLLPGPASSYPHELTAVGNRLLFVADDGVAGYELWVSDGAVTGRLPEIAPGPASSAPSEITRAGDRLYFAATGPDGRELWALDTAALEVPPCVPGPGRLCLADGRFEVTVRWRDQHNGGREGTGQAVPESNDSGFFWFFGPENLELAVKILDAGPVNGRFWVFFGALSDVEYRVTVTDRGSGTTRTYHNPAGTFCGQADTATFPAAATAARQDFALLNASALELPAPGKAGACLSGPESLCLLGGRFRVEARFRDPETGAQTPATAAPKTDNAGSFSFFDQANVELLVKLLDGQGVNGKLWLFYGALSDVEYWIDVTDTATGAVKSYHNPPGTYCGRADTRAF